MQMHALLPARWAQPSFFQWINWKAWWLNTKRSSSCHTSSAACRMGMLGGAVRVCMEENVHVCSLWFDTLGWSVLWELWAPWRHAVRCLCTLQTPFLGLVAHSAAVISCKHSTVFWQWWFLCVGCQVLWECSHGVKLRIRASAFIPSIHIWMLAVSVVQCLQKNKPKAIPGLNRPSLHTNQSSGMLPQYLYSRTFQIILGWHNGAVLQPSLCREPRLHGDNPAQEALLSPSSPVPFTAVWALRCSTDLEASEHK